MSTWYSANPYDKEPMPVEVEKATEKMVTINGHRRHKIGHYKAFFPTKAEAWDYLERGARERIQVAEARIKSAKIEVERHTNALERIRAARDC